MAYTVEINGRDVEFENKPTEADIDEAARQLGLSAQPAAAAAVPMSEPAGTESGLQMTAEPSAAQITAGAVAPSVTAVGMQPLGVSKEAIGQVVKPIWDTAREAYRGPMGVVRGVADATLMAHGVPPLAGPYSAAENITKRMDALKQAGIEASKGLSQTPMTTAPTGSQYPSGVPDYRTMQKAMPDAGARLTEIYQKGGPNAVKAFLQTPEAAQYMNNPAFKQAAESYIGKVPGLMAQAGKVVGPVLRGAARVAGPVGMGMNLYDAGQMARETQLGERLAQGQGGMAQNAFRQGLGMTYQGPQLQPQEAQNVLQSGSQRDIRYFGGEDRLREMIRKKAAEKVLGPIAPGSF